MIKDYEYQSEFARTYYGQGRADGQRFAIMQFARARFAQLASTDEDDLNALADVTELERIVVDVAVAPTYEAFHELLASRMKRLRAVRPG